MQKSGRLLLKKKKKLHHDKITFSIHCKKGVSDFLPSPAGMPHTKQLFPARESLVSDIRLGKGKSLTFFTVYTECDFIMICF